MDKKKKVRRAAAAEGSFEKMLSHGEFSHMRKMYESARDTLSEDASRTSEEKAHAEMKLILTREPWRDLEVVEGAPYTMEGECGVWTFKTHKVVERGKRRAIFDTRWELPDQRGKQRLRTSGVQELTLFLGPSVWQSQKCAEMFSRIRHQKQPVAVTTLRDYAEREGEAVQVALVDAVEREMAKPPPPKPEAQDFPALAAEEVEAAFADAEVPAELKAEALANPVPYTSPDETVCAAADAVFCKKQKEHRKEGKPAGNDRKTVSNCCATVGIMGVMLLLVSPTYEALARAVLATIRSNGLGTKHVCLLTDGERKLRDVFLPLLGGALASFYHVLDWDHLSRRCGQLLSLALKGKEIRNRHLTHLRHLLWHGCVDSAIAALAAIPSEDVKNQKKIDELAEYLRSRRPYIPVYAVRKELGLPNSSNPVEKANDRLVSSRQKGKGMSWSQEGSSAIANLRMVRCNKQRQIWLNKREVSLNLPDIAA